jgi:hypothetical protein
MPCRRGPRSGPGAISANDEQLQRQQPNGCGEREGPDATEKEAVSGHNGIGDSASATVKAKTPLLPDEKRKLRPLSPNGHRGAGDPGRKTREPTFSIKRRAWRVACEECAKKA